jgi:sulfur-oxidizing protein SoxA
MKAFAALAFCVMMALMIKTKPILATDNSKPEADLKAFQAYFHNRFPDVKTADFANGPYVVDAEMR